jgi:TPR repeat protein
MQQLLRPLADEGNARAQYNLGESYYYGYGEPMDGAQAAMWFRKAADQGDVAAQLRLGSMYSTGYGVQRDYKQAYRWLSLAASSVTEIGEKAARGRDIIAAMMAPAEIAEAQRLAAEWVPKPAK